MATYNYNYNGSSGGNDWGSWIPIIILFCIPTPVTWIIAFIWLVSKLRGSAGRGRDRNNVKRHPYDIQQDAQRGHPYEQDSQNWQQAAWDDQHAQAQRQSGPSQTRRQYNPGQAQRQAPPSQTQRTQNRAADTGRVYSAARSAPKAKAPERKQDKKSSAKKARQSGLPWIITGVSVMGVFSLGFIVTLMDAISSNWWYDASSIVSCALFFLGGLITFCNGVSINRRSERYINYLAYIGANREVSLTHMAATFDVSVSKLCKDLRRMLAKGILPTGYLDLAEGKLFLTEMGYRPAPARPEPKPEEERAQAERNEDAILREIRQVNDEIPDAEMTAKIDRIEEITGKILAYQKTHPNRESQLRTFLNYYLPTTLKILRAYAQLDAQGIEGENISAAKARIEGMMDQVVAGFEKQLDKLFQDDALDIAADVEVLENMLKKDGLSDGQGITLEL